MNNKKIKSFTDLMVWQEAYKLVLLIYKITKLFPKEETYSLTDQMRRSSSSITANIAEGFGRQSYKEKVQFYYLSQGSLTELKNFILISNGIGYLNKENLEQLIKQSNFVHQLLQGFIKKTKTFLILKS